MAEKAYAQGARLVLTNAPVAMRMGSIGELAEKTGSEAIMADATSMKDLDMLFLQIAGDIRRQDRLCASFHWHVAQCPQGNTVC